MKIVLRALATTLLLGASSSVSFAETTTTGGVVSAAKPSMAKVADQVICKTQTNIGSRLGGAKTCLTRAQWDAMGRDAADALNDRVIRAGQGVPPGR